MGWSRVRHLGQPDTQLGVIPGMGGTQRLVRAIGKSAAMEMILTGARVTAEHAEEAGLVSAVYPPKELMAEALKMANTIAGHSPLVVAKAKD
ncbi:hypothetical protein WJX72_003993 [[Myrmecia] bisecta]|uniref:Enoyl-CoA hydratase n=1 Tax=[Myrmecia] bisecta TaxID=41462 RepID=A0AAW1P905_9CHLO